MEILGFALATLIGMSLGLLGGGGSILTVPVMVYVLGFGAKSAIAMSLPVVGVTSIVGALRHWRLGNIDWRAGGMFGVVAMAGAYLGARVADSLTGAVQLTILSLVMLVAAISMLRSRKSDEADRPSSRVALPQARMLAVGLGVGLLTGVVGIGGGFLIVPALVVLGHVPMKQAIGTSLLVIAMNSAAGFAGYAGSVDVPWRFLAAFTAFAMAGIVIGTWLVRFVPAATLRRAFGVFLVAVGLLMLYQNRGSFTAIQSPPGAPAGAEG